MQEPAEVAASPIPRLGWLDRLSLYRQPIGLALTLILFALGLLACWQLLHQLDPEGLRAALFEVPRASIYGALAATALSFVALFGYEWSAMRYAGVKLPTARLALGSFCAFSIGNAVGFSLLSGGSVRYRLYVREGLRAGDIARISLFASLSLGCALPPLAALAALSDLPAAAQALQLPAALVGVLGVAILLGCAALALFLARRRLAQSVVPGSVEVQVSRWQLRLPGARLSLLQLLITLVDVGAAATVLYLLLPEAPPFGSFLLVYLLALAAGVLSHVPGGIGVFEALLLAAFAGQLGAAPLAAALVLYRLIYVGLPLALGCLLLLADEARRLLGGGREALRLASTLAAPVLSLLVFVAGVVLLLSGATPAIDERLDTLRFLIPHRLIDISHLAASLVGVLCLLLAQGLRQRLSAAWALTLALLVVGAGLSLLKGVDWEEALLLSITAALLAGFRKAFYRPSRLLEMPLSAVNLVAAACVLAASTWLMFFVYQNVPYEHELWWQFAVDADTPRSLRATLASFLLLAILGLAWLLRPPPPEIHEPDEADLQRALTIIKASEQPDGGLVLTGDKAILFHPKGDAFLMYARRGRSLVALFDPIGPAAERGELIWQFRDLCDHYRARPVFYQVRAENLPYYMDIGLSAIKLGEEASVDLAAFDLDSKGKKDLRYTWNRGQRDGLGLVIHQAGGAPMEQLAAISEAWMQGKQAREKGFSLGRFDTDYLRHFRIAVVLDKDQPVAFASLLETDGKEVASLDLMRVHPKAPKLTMEFLMLGLILHFKEAGHARFSLGMVPLAGLQVRRGAPLAQRLGSLVFQRGEQFYNFQGLRRFKDKFDPRWEPRYMAVPAGLNPLLALADTAALIAGGLTGLVKR